MPFVLEPAEVVRERDEKMYDQFDQQVKETITSTPVDVETEDLLDGSKVVTQLPLAQIHVLEQLALKMATDPDILGTLPFSFYRKIIKVWIKRIWHNIKRRFGCLNQSDQG